MGSKNFGSKSLSAFLPNGEIIEVTHGFKKQGYYFFPVLAQEKPEASAAIPLIISGDCFFAKTRHYASKIAEKMAALIVENLEQQFNDELRCHMLLINKKTKVRIPLILGRYCHISPIMNAMDDAFQSHPVLKDIYTTAFIKQPGLQQIAPWNAKQQAAYNAFKEAVLLASTPS